MTDKTHTVFCLKLQKDAEGLDVAPFPGEIGKKIYDNISKEAWQQWQQRQTMLINEYRLNLADKEARQFLSQQMQDFLFEGSEVRPEGFRPPKDS